MDTSEKSILIVDNELGNTGDLAVRFRSNGFKTIIASGGFHAVNLVEKESIDMVILIDNLMDMGGEEVLSLLRSIKSRDELPIIYMSYSNDEKESVQVLNLGANDICLVEITFVKLLEKVKKNLCLNMAA